MADQPVTREKLINADKDVQVIEDFIKKPKDETVTTRFGDEIMTLKGLEEEVKKSGGYFKRYTSLAAANADIANIPVNGVVKVTDAVDGGDYEKAAAGATDLTKSPYDSLVQAKTYTNQLTHELNERTFSTSGKNLFDKSKVVRGEYYYPTGGKIATSTNWRRSGFIPVVAGQTYTLSGNISSNSFIAWYATTDKNSNAISHSTSKVAQVAPVGANFAVFNLTNVSQDDTTYDSTAQFELGNIATSYEAYVKKIAKDDVSGIDEIEQSISGKLTSSDVLEFKSHNLIDPSKCDYVRRYSTASKGFTTDTLSIAASAYIPVVAGEWYVVSGEYFGNTVTPQGGYFTSPTETAALDNITWTKPVDNVGHCFQVPLGSAITHVVINLKKTAVGSTVLNGNVQLELGEQATAYQPYLEKAQIKSALLPSNSSGGSGSVKFDDAAWYKYVAADGAKIHQDKLPKFRKAMLLKNEDVVVVNTGTSLTARTSEHCTDHADAAFRPPMMHSNAFCSHIWDALKWDGQQYRRYDSAYFSETGTFATASNLAEWDDGAYRAGLTRYSSSENAAVQFQIPVNAWQFNFIYRTDSLGCNAKVAIAEGVGKVQVYDEATSSWVEAHNYEFSQLEATPVARSVNIPNPVTGTLTAATIASKGNTTYQKRLKMRCRSGDGAFNTLTTDKSVTIARVGGGARFMYWGVEWSPRQYMITYINAARGSHNTNAASERGLPRFQDNEIWSFKPTLILSELGIHNDGAGGAGPYPVGQFAGLTFNYVNNTDFELSMFSRAAHFNLEPEYCFFTASIAYNFNGIEEDGSLKFGLQAASTKGDARMMTALDKTQEAIEYLKSIDIPAIDATKRWCDAGFAIFGDLKSATLGSGKDGSTFTNEGSHWNDTGSKIMAKVVLPLI
ncbi:hypothetical protein [Acinetobacter pseudolwoffii]|uniref:hypothetical protein n=1 Tax=Acinetobacter pseudolwoffii TaxID=2053287 RepID=UPI002468CBD4|nr:hypothetical protein [Acinetobacter pseudolwoffii]MDH5819491.1 hypothetical protein [Acinetobacter pseudolwoffii]